MLLKLIHDGIPGSDHFTGENLRIEGLTPICGILTLDASHQIANNAADLSSLI
jgi:hypothetical protein